MMRIPDATYRIQFNSHFGFRDAAGIVSYLKDLGISDLYASPVFEAVPGSTHGYDICNPDRLNPELGSLEDFEALSKTVQEAGLGWIQDIVPNHLAFHSGNRRLMDVLENGESFYRTFFDIDWNHPSMPGKVIAPFLGRHYAQCLEAGEITLQYDEDGLSIRYYSIGFPLSSESYVRLLQPRLQDFEEAEEEARQDLLNLADLLKRLEYRGGGEPADRIALFKRDLWDRYSRKEAVREFIDARICPFQAGKKSSEVLSMLDDLLRRQSFKPVYWQNADTEINYRRFFLINGLIGVHAEAEAVFLDTHSLILKLVQDRHFTGLRIDHIDGLYDPERYLHRLKESVGERYIMVEKILDAFEELPPGWPVQGATGYEFLNRLNGLFCDNRNENAFSKLYQRFTGIRIPFPDLLRETRRSVLETFMAGDLDNHAHMVEQAAHRDRYGRDFTFHNLRRALAAFLVCFPVYRSYATRHHTAVSDRNYLVAAFEEARLKHPDLAVEISFLERVMPAEAGDCASAPEPGEREAWSHILMRLQQIMGSLMAKGLEDTVFYVYNRLLSLNEVGGHPARFGTPPAEFHRFLETRREGHPHALNATATHDTKRGEDVRARLNVLSEIPGNWEKLLREWSAANRRKKKKVGDLRVPEGNTEYFLYQSLVGGFPFLESDLPAFTDRLKEYMIKAVREAKEHTSWSDPDPSYEEALSTFIDRILEPSDANTFLPRFRPFQRKMAFYGIFNSLSQVLAKITAPGVPDFYQGTELWDLTFVDPDNRRAIDFETRNNLLQDMIGRSSGELPSLIRDMLQNHEDGRLKLFLIRRALQARCRNRELFRDGDFRPVKVEGRHANHVIAFRRSHGDRAVLTVVPRFLTALILEGEYPFGPEIWQDTALVLEDGASWQETITEAEVPQEQGRILVGHILKSFPVGLLLKKF